MKIPINSEEEFLKFLREKSNNSNIQRVTDYFEDEEDSEYFIPVEYPCIVIYDIDEVTDYEKEDSDTEYFIDIYEILYKKEILCLLNLEALSTILH